MKRVLALFLLACTLTGHAQAAQGIALWGGVKYPANFTHFDYVNPNAPKGGSMKLSTNASFDSMNPFVLKGVAAPGLGNYLYQSLMVQAYDEPQSYYPLIASAVTVAPDHSYAEFTINPKARWQDGKAITSADVVWSFTTLKEKGHPSFKVQFAPMTAEALGAYTVRFHFADRTRRELPLLAASMPVLPKHGFCREEVIRVESRESSGEEVISNKLSGQSKEKLAPSLHSLASPSLDSRLSTLATPPCTSFEKTSLAPPLGSGPYRVSEVKPGRSITFTRVKDYWGAELPSQQGFYNFDTIQYDVYRDDTVALEGIKSHQFDFYEEFIARNWATAYEVPAVKSGALVKTLIPHQIPRGMQGFMFNTRLPKFADKRVREAIGLTLDFDWMNQKLFYGAYSRAHSYFGSTEFEGVVRGQGSGVSKEATAPSPQPLAPSPGYPRPNLIRAQELLNAAGWVMKDGVRVNAKTGEPLVIEFLMTQRTFERVIAVMRHNLNKLGIAANFRYVDPSQYQKRLERKQFDMVSVWWNQGLFYPGNEQYLYWHSSQAGIEGSQNLSGAKNPVVDRLVEQIQSAPTLGALRRAGQALDRTLIQEHYMIPHWNLNAWRVVYWNQFGRPAITPAYNLGIDTWWREEEVIRVESRESSKKEVSSEELDARYEIKDGSEEEANERSSFATAANVFASPLDSRLSTLITSLVRSTS